MEWKPYPDDRIFCRLDDGLVVIRPVDPQQVMSFFCEICDNAMRTLDDEESWRKFGCCDVCARNWAYPKRPEWESGWRPTKEQVKASKFRTVMMKTMLDVG